MFHVEIWSGQNCFITEKIIYRVPLHNELLNQLKLIQEFALIVLLLIWTYDISQDHAWVHVGFWPSCCDNDDWKIFDPYVCNLCLKKSWQRATQVHYDGPPPPPLFRIMNGSSSSQAQGTWPAWCRQPGTSRLGLICWTASNNLTVNPTLWIWPIAQDLRFLEHPF